MTFEVFNDTANRSWGLRLVRGYDCFAVEWYWGWRNGAVSLPWPKRKDRHGEAECTDGGE